MREITINCDLGEGFGIYSFGDDEACMPWVTHANIACGFHASDPVIMWDTVRKAMKHGLVIGAHPGLPDREGFGRRPMKMTRKEVASIVLYQAGALKAFLEAEGGKLEFLKAHGALFGMAQNETEVAEGLGDALEHLGIPAISFSDTCMTEVFTRRGIPFTCEFYADLQYGPDGRQIITRSHGAYDLGSLEGKMRRAVSEGKTRATDGSDVAITIESVCVHADGKTAVEVARTVHETLKAMGVLYDLGRHQR